MKNVFHFTLKTLLVLKIFKFLSLLFGHVAERLDQKYKVPFKFYDVTAWLTNNCNTHIAHISRSKDNHVMKFGQLIEHNMRNIFFLKNHTQNVLEKLFPDP